MAGVELANSWGKLYEMALWHPVQGVLNADSDLLLGCTYSVLVFYRRFLQITLALMDFPFTIRFIAQASEFSCDFILFGYVSIIFNILGLILILFTFKIYRNSYSHSKALKYFPSYYLWLCFKF
ncbi:hypothetical protein Ahy_A03g011920 isoform D [Arachis hypogaea]|uniref:Uncharacterized protein n=1 Tax=Arachis hypogaea TaxID=3818 RepID=A0A445DS41_ARAHY|nr:hypothetical protein Ahy_A03g011920 isoform D [Arachis hypogaea]